MSLAEGLDPSGPAGHLPSFAGEERGNERVMLHRLAAIAVAALMVARTALAQEKQPPLRTGVDGTFAPHAMPRLGGGTEGFQIDVFTEVARRLKRDITIDSVSFSTLIPGMQAGRYDFIAAPT